MNFSRNKAERVADHLRTAIRQRDLTDPLPSIRAWSVALGISPSTLQGALAILKDEGWLAAQSKKGYRLTQGSLRTRGHAQVVRWLWHDPRSRSSPPPSEILIECSQRLAACDIHFQFERCDEARLRAIHAAGSHRDEVLVFSNIGATIQRLFASHRNVLMVGDPASGIALPHVSCDIFPIFRHAAYRLLRHGCERVELLNIIGRRHLVSFQILEDEFRKIREEAPRPFQGGVTLVPTPHEEQCRTVRRMARRFTGKQGLIVNAPLLPGLVVMALQDFGLKIPDDVEILPVNSTPGQLAVYPPLAHYPYPIQTMAKTICSTAYHYFKSGKGIQLRKQIPLTLVPA